MKTEGQRARTEGGRRERRCGGGRKWKERKRDGDWVPQEDGQTKLQLLLFILHPSSVELTTVHEQSQT